MRCLLICFLTVLCMPAAEVISADTGEAITGHVFEPRSVFSFDPQVIHGDRIAVASLFDADNPTSELYLWSTNYEVIAIGTTKIRAEYPQDHTLLQTKVAPKHHGYKDLGKDDYKSTWLGENASLVFLETNLACGFSGQNDLQFLIHSNGFNTKGSYTRTDMHFVKDGHYIQIVAVSPKQFTDTHELSSSLLLCRRVYTAILGQTEEPAAAPTQAARDP